MKKQLLASIIISSYHYGRFLKACIDSALNQDLSPHRSDRGRRSPAAANISRCMG